MPPPEIDRTAFARARTHLADGEQRLVATRTRLQELARRRAVLLARGASDEQVAATDEAIAAARTRRDELAGRVRDARRRLDGLADELARDIVDPGRLVELLSADRPVVLLPVRLETRFTDDARALRVRIFPDQLHLDGHDPELTESEVAAGTAYWQAVWPATGDEDEPVRAAAWEAMTSDVAATRARWVVEAMTPTNLATRDDDPEPVLPSPETVPDSWVRPVRATALPDRWLAIGRRGGRTVVRGWSRHVPDELPTTPAPGQEDDDAPVDTDGVPLDPELRWLVDYEAAEAVGMALTLRPTARPGERPLPLSEGLDSLLVVGVDWTLSPEEAADRLEHLLDGHRWFDGLAHVPTGTATNQTSATEAARVAPTGRDAASLRPDADAAPPEPGDGSGADRLQAALGVAAAGLAHAPGADGTAADTALLLQDVVFPSTLGYYLDDLLAPVVGDDMIAFAREFVGRHLVPGGPLPTLRVGPQPYGFLPCVAPGEYEPPAGAPFERQLFPLLQSLRPAFRLRTVRLPRMGASDDPGDDLLPLLQRGPLAQSARFRQVHGPAYWHNVVQPTGGAAEPRWSTVGHSAWATLLALRPTFLAGLTPDEDSYRLPVPWVQAGAIAPGMHLEPDYLGEIADLLEAADGRAQLLARQNANTLLEALAAAAATEELDRRLAELAKRFRVDAAAITEQVRTSLATTELLGVEQVTDEVPDGAVRVETHEQLAAVRLSSLTGDLTLADYVTTRLRAPDPEPPVRAFADYVDRLRELATRPVDELDHAFRGFLDATSHRLDAWYTALATQRLDALRRQQPTGVHIGGWGWVEDLRPDPRPDSLGYVHAPSLAHATTAALLRSGHLTHRDPDDRDKFDMQLSSRRVGPAMAVLDGIAQGQSLAALLGYRLERAIHEDALTLAQFILPLRRLAPLDGRDPGELPDGTFEAIAARDVVDGVALLERWRDDGNALFDELDPAPDAAARSALAGHLDALEAVFDAVGDVLVAETVHQSALGNYERAGAALAALDRQEAPPDPDVLATPRTGARCTQRVVVLLADDDPRPAWRPPDEDVRAAVAPRVDAWVAGLLPDPPAIRFAGVLRAGDGTETPLAADAADLGLSALSLVAAARAGSGDQPSELEQRIVAALVAGEDAAVAAAGADAELELLDDPPADAGPTTIGLAALRAQLLWIAELLARARPLRLADLALPDEAADDPVDGADLAARADLASDRLDAAIGTLDAVVADEAATVSALEGALLAAATVAADGAVPPVGDGDPDAHRQVLVEQAARVLGDLQRRRAGLADMVVDHAGADPPPDDAATAAHHAARIRQVLGQAFPVVGRVTFADDDVRRVELAASTAEGDVLTGGDPLAARAFVDRMAVVRPDLRRLSDVLLAAELFETPGADPERFTVAQLPHVPDQHWFALPQPPPDPEPDLALVLHHAGGPPGRDLELDASLAGLVVDEWVESVPSPEETTGLTFHYDAPAARPPQAVLLAVPGGPDQEHWTLDGLVATVREAMDLARLRGLTPDELPFTGQFLPMTWLPHRFTRDQVPPPLHTLLANWADHVVAEGVVGKQYLDTS